MFGIENEPSYFPRNLHFAKPGVLGRPAQWHSWVLRLCPGVVHRGYGGVLSFQVLTRLGNDKPLRPYSCLIKPYHKGLLRYDSPWIAELPYDAVLIQIDG